MTGLLKRAVIGTVVGGLAAAGGVQAWQLPDLHRQLAATEQARAEMDEATEVLEFRIETKELLIQELCAGRLTLEAVADRFLALNSGQPATMAVIRSAYPSADDRETTARNVLGYVAVHEFAAPAERDIVLARVRAEFARLFPAGPH